MDQYNYSEHQKTSVKVHHQPGGTSQWSLGWGYDQGAGEQQRSPQKKQPIYNQSPAYYGNKAQNLQKNPAPQNYPPPKDSYTQYAQQQQQSFSKQPQYQARDGSGDRTSVKVHAPPGGQQSINIFGGQDGGDRYARNASPNRSLESTPYRVGGSYQVPQPRQYEQPTRNMQQQRQSYAHPKVGGNQQIFKYQQGSPQADEDSKVKWPSAQPDPRQQAQRQLQSQWQPSPSYVPTKRDQNSPVRRSQQVYPSSLGVSSSQRSLNNDNQVFGQRVESGSNSGPYTGVPSTKVHAPPGGRSQINLI